MLKGYVKLEVFIHRNVLEKDKKDFLREKHTFMGTFTHTHKFIFAAVSGKFLKYTKLVFCIFLSSHTNLDAFSLCTHFPEMR